MAIRKVSDLKPLYRESEDFDIDKFKKSLVEISYFGENAYESRSMTIENLAAELKAITDSQQQQS